MLTLRPYQEQAKLAVYDHLRTRDDNPCVVIPTAGGKSPLMASICKDAVGLWRGRVLLLAHVKELLEQTADKLTRVCPEVDFGIYSAGLKRRDTTHSVIIAGIQSVYKRACELEAFDLVIVDEAHLIPLEGDGMYRQFLADARVVNPNLRVIGFTATPFRLKTGPICTPDGFLNHICYEIGVRELIRDGFLCPLITKAGTSKADTSGLHTRGGDFVADEVESLMDQDALVSAACAEIIAYSQDRNACLIFASGVPHGRHIVDVLTGTHAVDCGFVCGETPIAERDATLGRFRSGVLKYLVNVNVLTTGFDAPHIDLVGLVRPTMSPGLYYQMCLDMETEILAPGGWRRCHEVTTGDMVASFDLTTEEIVYAPAQDKIHRPLRSPESMLGVSAPHLDIRVTDQHNLVVRGRAKSCLYWHLQPASEAADRRESFTIPVAGRGEQHCVDAALTDAEVAFVGWFLTDGYLNRSNNVVAIAQSINKHADELRKVLTECGFGFCEYQTARVGKCRGYADGLQFVIARGKPRGERAGSRGWQDLAAWLDKDIPRVFDALSTRQFGILLHAMNLANGSNRATVGYRPRVMNIAVGCRQRMADRIQQLAIERGYRCNVSSVIQQPNDWNRNPQRQWMVRVKPQQVAIIGGTRNDTSPVWGDRCRLESLPFMSNEWVWCLTTELGTLVTRRNGKVAIVGNCGRGFRIHPGKQNCLVLDFGGNVLRHGPVDQIKITTRPAGNGEAPAKECPECQAVIAAGYAACPECGYEFPPPERKKHDAKASEAGILSGQVTDTKYLVRDIIFSVHTKRGAADDAPRTMRVDYQLGLNHWQAEYVCFEHQGYARQKAVAWWRRRSPDPVPDTAERAVELAEAGALCATEAIVVRTVTGEKFDQVVGYKLGPMPESVAAGGHGAYGEVPF
jgi:Type III restriction enzyme, res subunit/Helicase conserved C-terminal domain